jgi:protein LSM14
MQSKAAVDNSQQQSAP